MTEKREPLDMNKAREKLGVEGILSIEEYADAPRFVSSEKCEWRVGDNGLIQCLPKSGIDPCSYCARLKVTKQDGTVEIHCLCWD